MLLDLEGITADLLAQVIHLGIALDDLPYLGRTLDVGCGKEAELVHLLRRQAVAAEGIDTHLEENDYLIQRFVFAQQSIPRPSTHYNLVTAHRNSSLCDPRTDLREKDPEQLSWRATRILWEMLRVTQKGGEVRVFPSLKFLDEKFDRLGLKVEHPRTELAANYNFNVPPPLRTIYEDMFNYRTVIRRPK